MNNSRIIGALGLLVGVAGFVYAIYQGIENVKIKNYNRSQAWYLYSKANVVTGHIQKAYKTYKTKNKKKLDLETVELFSKGDAFGQDLLAETVRQIQLSEPIFDLHMIDQWVSSKKIVEKHKRLFTQIMIENKIEEEPK